MYKSSVIALPITGRVSAKDDSEFGVIARVRVSRNREPGRKREHDSEVRRDLKCLWWVQLSSSTRLLDSQQEMERTYIRAASTSPSAIPCSRPSIKCNLDL